MSCQVPVPTTTTSVLNARVNKYVTNVVSEGEKKINSFLLLTNYGHFLSLHLIKS